METCVIMDKWSDNTLLEKSSQFSIMKLKTRNIIIVSELFNSVKELETLLDDTTSFLVLEF